MVLTVCIGASGSGKTTFLEDVHKAHKCTYIRQYHNLRPFIPVHKIPNFDPTALPFWKIYEKENPKVAIGGTMAGQFNPGFSGGQRKMLLFELIYQRTKNMTDLLLCLDEPFAGVTDDFVPYLKGRLEDMASRHNVLLVTNDHVDAMRKMAKNTIIVSAIDRSTVTINDEEGVDRTVALHAVSNGNDYVHENTSDDLRFFFEVEVFSTAGGIGAVMGFTTFAMLMIILSFWDSSQGSEALVLVGVQIVAFFCINPYLISLADWRTYMTEEAEALLHASVPANKALKSTLTLIILLVISVVAFGVLNICIDTMTDAKYFVHMLFDSASLTFPFICVGLYTDLPLQIVQLIASMPFLFMIFFSTTFSPGAGVEAIKELRFLFARFYFWCDLPGIRELMDGCPADNMLVPYSIMSGCLGLFLFLVVFYALKLKAGKEENKKETVRAEMEASEAFQKLQKELFGSKIIASPKASSPKGGSNGFELVSQNGEEAI